MVRDCWRTITGTPELRTGVLKAINVPAGSSKGTLDPWPPPLLCYWEVFSLFKSLCCCWKEKHQAPRQRESKQPAHLTTLLSGANSSLGIHQGWGHPGSPFCICNLCPSLFGLLHGSYTALPSRQPLIKYYAKNKSYTEWCLPVCFFFGKPSSENRW